MMHKQVNIRTMIEFRNIDLSYNGKYVFKNLSFHIRKGEKTVVLGKSGLGKSSLFHLLLGFVPFQQGQILFNGTPVNADTVWDIRKKIAFVDQDVSIGQGRVRDFFYSLFTMKANSAKSFPQAEIDSLFDYFELDKTELNKNIEDLSGGERQRVAIIASILLGRDVFLFDEITSSLDARLKEKTVNFFTKNTQWTVVVISHDSIWLHHPHVRVFNLEDNSWKR